MSKRPINLNLLTIRFPMTAIVSILHRLSGFLLFLAIPVFLMLMTLTLQSPEAFFTVHVCFEHPLMKLFLFGFFAALFYHLFAGIRHLFMDAGVADTLKSAQWTAGFVMVATLVLTSLMGIYLW